MRYVGLTPYADWYSFFSFSRIATTFDMSTSIALVTCADVSSERRMCSAIPRRIAFIGSNCSPGCALLGRRAADLAELRADLDRLALLDEDLRQRSRRRRRNLGVDLVGRDLEQRLVRLDLLTLLLQPLRDCPLGDGDAHLGHHDVDGGFRCHVGS